MGISEFTVTSLRVVREVAEHGSFSAAAAHLGYTQSAVSKQVAFAEAVAGCTLFERRARGVVPTEAGRLVVRRAESVLGELSQMRREIGDLSSRPPTRLRVGAFSSAMGALVPRTLRRFSTRGSRTAIQLQQGASSTNLNRLARRALDIAVVTPPEKWPPGVTGAALLEDPLLVAVHRGHPLAGSGSVAPDELESEVWIAGSLDPATEFLGPWTASEWTPRVSYVARSWIAKLGLVAAARGVTLVPGLAVPTLPDTIAVVQIEHAAASRTTAVATGASPVDPETQAFSETLRDVAADLQAEVRRRLHRP